MASNMKTMFDSIYSILAILLWAVLPSASTGLILYATYSVVTAYIFAMYLIPVEIEPMTFYQLSQPHIQDDHMT